MTRRKIAAAVALATLAGGALAQAGARFDFQADALDAPPAGFTFARTGQGAPGRWVVKLDPTSPAGDHVLAQVDGDTTGYRFPVAIADAPALRDLRAEVRCRPVAGHVDQACGLVVRYRDAGNYYVARANALEGNVNLYRVVGGRREELAGWSGEVASGAWHALAVEARGEALQVSWEGKPVIRATDRTFRDAGKVGVWTKADSITHFDALTVTPLP
ncbi:MAG TPA: hypothetical protein VFP50_17380 [Anaeromyxobacteraceae bacterium]|nr:hypothetical protein [Anaeromyxobacteraceae bacterium]